MSSEPRFDQNERITRITAAPIARDGYPLGRGYETLVTIARSDQEKGHGPWAFIVDEAPGAAGEGVPGGGLGPSPVATTLGGLAAWTISTLGGVARRRNMPLREMRVEIHYSLGPRRPPGDTRGKSGAEDNAAEGLPGRTRKAIQKVIVKGELSERDRQLLTNAMKFCPVKQMLRGGTMEFDEELVVEP